MDRPNFLYKYTSLEAAHAIIRNSTLKLSVPQAFNDPFDILLEEVLGADIDIFLTDLKPAVFDLASGDLDYSTVRQSAMGEKIKLINRHLKHLPPAILAKIRQEFLGKPLGEVWDLSFLRGSITLAISTIQKMLDNYGVFCSSTNKNSLLMWSHYADHHRGVVLELRPDIEQDSPLLASRPVRYSAERPLLYHSAHDILQKSLLMQAEDAAKGMLDSLIYTKSPEWEYECEYRLAIPHFVPEGASAEYLSFYPGELSRIYFGCRMTDEQRSELKARARNLTPDVKFSRAVMARRAYALEWLEDD